MAVHVLGDCYLPITIIITFVYQLIVFFITFTLQVDTATDIGGGSNVALLAILTLVLSQTYHTRQIIATTFQIVWGLRLGFSFMNSEKVVEFADPNFGSVADILGVILFVIGFLIESIADIQKLIFRINRSSSDEFIKTGLWAWMVLLFISGLPLSERPTHIKQFKAGNWSEYSKYLSRTSCLIPFPPALYEPLPQIIKSTLFLEFPIYRFDPESEGDLVEKDKNKSHFLSTIISSVSGKRLNLDSYNAINIEDWTYIKLVNHYRDNLERKNLSYILENIKKDLEKVANSESEFDEERRNKAQEIIDHWKLWKASSKKRKMNLKRDFSHFKINSLKVKQHMVATGSNAIQISNSRKHLRNNHGEPVKISSEKIVECDEKLPEDTKEWTSD
ncbi:12364_t:CDS:10 [Gigaspora rosea]|nr:12364_t:CDS:10 [Gigaspora rosea]